MWIRVTDWESSEVIAEVLVEPQNSVAFLKHRIWELTLASLPRCGQSLYDGDIELEDEHALEVYGLQSEHTIEYSPAWHEPYCPGCSDCERNFCSAVLCIQEIIAIIAIYGLSHGHTAQSATMALLQQNRRQLQQHTLTPLKTQTPWSLTCQKH